ncbi:MAG: DMT family transporter [Rhodobacterales bacterium]|nr:DMT family transporter [Rhodobacterales bacterium]
MPRGPWYANPHLLLVLTMLFWSGNAICGRLAGGLVPPVSLATWRWTLAFLVVVPFAARWVWRDRALLLRHWRLIVLLGLLGSTAYNLLIYFALSHTTAVNVTLVGGLGPLMVPVVAWMLDRTRIGGRQLLALGFCLAGVMVVIGRGDPTRLAALHVGPGDLFTLAAVVDWAFYAVLLRRLPPGLHPLAFLATTFGVGVLGHVPFYIWEWVSGARMVVTPLSLGLIVYVGLFPSILSFMFWNRAVAQVGATTAGLFMNLVPLFAAGLAYMILGEHLAPYHVVAFLCVFTGIAVGARIKAPRQG